MTESAPATTTPQAGETAPGAAAAPGGAPDELREEIRSLKDRLLYLQAEFENFRKRKHRETSDIRKYAAVPVFESLIPVIDHFELALGADHSRTDPAWAQGIELIARQLFEALRSSGLEPIEASAGDPFDPGIHEAVERRAEAGVAPGSIVAQTRRGYRLAERVIRPAHVAVAAEPAAQPAAQDDSSAPRP